MSDFAPLPRITDFDSMVRVISRAVDDRELAAENCTRIDRVSHLVSDEMMAADRAEREQAFAVLP